MLRKTRLRLAYGSSLIALIAGCFTAGQYHSKEALPAAHADEEFPVGYADTPKLPDSRWRVHDVDRPRPRVVTPGASATSPPSDAIVLFDGTSLAEWAGKDGSPARWKVENGYLEVTNTGDIKTRRSFGSVQLHIEWRTPEPVQLRSQKRGNSGIFLAERYEVQVLDSFDNQTYADGQAGALYGQYPPLVNASRPPGQWQSYDIVFIAPEFEGTKMTKPARATVFHNGVLIHHDRAFQGATAHRELAHYELHGKAPLVLQDHQDRQRVRFRNIWLRELESM